MFGVVKEIPANVEKGRRDLGIDEVIPSFTLGKLQSADEGGHSSRRKAPAFLLVLSPKR